MLSRATVLFLLLAAGGCGAKSLGSPVPTGPCDGPADSNLPGVSLAFPDPYCTYTQGELLVKFQIPYQVVVAQDLTGVHPRPGDGGGCAQPDASGLIVAFTIAGAGQSYCLCDTGRCVPQSPVTAPSAGSYPAQIPWDGRNWSGPSDTGNPKGPPFPPGNYTLTLTALGTWDGTGAGGAPVDGGPGGSTDFAVTATRRVTIIPQPGE